MGVMFPPNVAPIRSPNNNSSGPASIPEARSFTTGIIAIMYGILSINAENKTDIHTINVNVRNRLLPVILEIKPAILEEAPELLLMFLKSE